MSGCIAVINAGSSSVKFALFEASSDAYTLCNCQSKVLGSARVLGSRPPRATH